MDPIWAAENNISKLTLNDNTSLLGQLEVDPLAAVDSSIFFILNIVFSSTALLAFVGNCLVIVVEVFGKKSAANIRKYLINLAISDLLIGVFTVPFVYTDFLLGRWIFPRWLCPVAQFSQVVSVFVTAFTLTNIGVERFAATLHPFANLHRWLRANGNRLLLAGWLIGVWLASVTLYTTRAQPFVMANVTYYDCRVLMTDSQHLAYVLVTFSITFVVPLIVMVVSYGAIGLQLYLYDSPSNDEHQIDKIKVIRRQIFKMLLTVVVMFFVCWFPIKLFILITVISKPDIRTHDEYVLYVAGFLIFHWLSMANSFVNPIIYCFMSRSFRADLIDLFSNVFSWMGLIKRANQSTNVFN